MKKLSKILSMVMVVGLIAAIPASTQIMSGSKLAAATGSDLPMLILVNRLELSEEQMKELNDILSDLVDEKEGVAELAAEFEQTMIEFNGSEEELDALLVTFREDQQALVAALGESIEASLDEVRDLLSINQGLVLQDELPQLLGGAILGTGQRNVRSQEGRTQMMGNRMASSSMVRDGMMPQATLRGRMRLQMQENMDVCTGTCEDNVVTGVMRGRVGSDMPQNPFGGRLGQDSTREEMATMMGQHSGQSINDETVETMRGRIQERLEQMGDQVPDALIERLGERFGGTIEEFGAQMGRSPMVDQSGNRVTMLGQERMEQRGGASLTMQHMQSTRSGHGNLFEVLEQVVDVLNLKLEALE